MKKKDLERELAEANEKIGILNTKLNQLTVKHSFEDRERPMFDKSGRRLAGSVGKCPECGGRVMEFEDRFACTYSTTDGCHFSIDRFYLEMVIMVDEPEIMEQLLEDRETTYWYNPCDPYDEEPHYEVHVKLLRSDDGRWYFGYLPTEHYGPNHR